MATCIFAPGLHVYVAHFDRRVSSVSTASERTALTRAWLPIGNFKQTADAFITTCCLCAVDRLYSREWATLAVQLSPRREQVSTSNIYGHQAILKLFLYYAVEHHTSCRVAPVASYYRMSQKF
jgi:hypothetical protein